MDYYDILGVPQSADSMAIRNAYRRKAVKFHPSKTDDVDSIVEFGLISEAYDVLMNQEWKALYDLYGRDVLKEGKEDEEGGKIGGCYVFDSKTDPFRLFKEAFATDNAYEAIYGESGKNLLKECSENLDGYQAPVRCKDRTVEFTCDLEEVFYGCTKTLQLARLIRTDTDSISEQMREVQIHVAPGEEDGAVYTFSGEGDVAHGKQPGNVNCILRIREHEKFVREKRDLVLKTHIPLHQAFLNLPIEVETLDKRKLSVVLPCMATPGFRHAIQGEGMQYPDKTRGDLIIEVSLIFQKKMSPLQKSVIKAAFLFPSSPTSEQLIAARAFEKAAYENNQGWLNGIKKE